MPAGKKKRIREVHPTEATATESNPSAASLTQTTPNGSFLAGPFTQISYGLTGLILSIFLLFLFNGYRLQPFVIVDNFIPLFLEQASGVPQGIVVLFEDQTWKVEKNQEGIPVLSVVVDKDRPAGFGIPKDLYPYEGTLTEAALSLRTIYTGYPVISYGFNRSIHLNNIPELGKNALTQEFTPVAGKFNPLWIMPTYVPIEKFEISFEEADILYLVIQSDRHTEIHIGQLTLIGKP